MGKFETLILLGRPASGKSEFIDFMKRIPEAERVDRFHIGAMFELDDFVWLWRKFEEDDIWEAAGSPRLYSKRAGHAYLIADGSVLDFCLAKFNSEHAKRPAGATTFVEFARGAGDGGYKHALSRLSDELLHDASILFIYTSYEESCRRNEARYREKLKHSVLAHKVPDEDMVRFSRDIDWAEVSGGRPSGRIEVRANRVPFVTMNNESELKEGPELVSRYKTALDELYTIRASSPWRKS